MIDQYPYVCSYAIQQGPDQYDQDTGKWTKGQDGQLIAAPCRATPNGSGRKEKNKDGQMVDYQFNLAFPVEIDDIDNNTEVTLTDASGKVLKEGRLLRFQRGQLHCLGWI